MCLLEGLGSGSLRKGNDPIYVRSNPVGREDHEGTAASVAETFVAMKELRKATCHEAILWRCRFALALRSGEVGSGVEYALCLLMIA